MFKKRKGFTIFSFAKNINDSIHQYRKNAVCNISFNFNYSNTQKQSFKGVLRKRCSENMQQFYRRTPSAEVALQLY